MHNNSQKNVLSYRIKLNLSKSPNVYNQQLFIHMSTYKGQKRKKNSYTNFQVLS